MGVRTEQELFWEGEFGDVYTERNKGLDWVASNTSFFSKVLHRTSKVESILELGANRGLNIYALQTLLPKAHLSAVEINSSAAAELRKNHPLAEVFNTSIFEFEAPRKWDLTFTKGVLIHINPEKLPEAYAALYNNSSKYIVIAEYYNPSPVELSYRGHSSKLFKRDFAGELMNTYNDLVLVDYGFVYHRDRNFPQDDISWFIMEKQPK